MARTQPDPLGAGFWSANEALLEFGGVLAEEYLPIREILSRMRADAAKKIGPNLNWLKFNVMKIIEVDVSRRDDVYVRRGENWNRFWDTHGNRIIERQVGRRVQLGIESEL